MGAFAQGQVETSRYGERQFIGAWVDQEQRELLTELARQQDRSVSAVIRRALDRELQRAANPEGAAAAHHLRSAPSDKPAPEGETPVPRSANSEGGTDD